MDLEMRLTELAKVVKDHREVLLTEEAAKNALVMPFLQALGYNVFNPGEVVPEYTADVGLKKHEKVDYAICEAGKIKMLVECKPANAELNISNAGQLFRYFSVTEARVALLTNGVVYQFYSDIDKPNKMDDRPFFIFRLDAMKKSDFSTLLGFGKAAFNVDRIVAEAVQLKLQSLVYKELQHELNDPSEDLIRLIARKIHTGQITAAVKENFKSLIATSYQSLLRDQVNDRLTSALSVSNPPIAPPTIVVEDDGIITTEEEIASFQIVRAIGAKLVDPKRIVMRDAKTYCAILLDDNNRKPIVRLHFNGLTTWYLGTFVGKDETRSVITEPVDLFRHSDAIVARLTELMGE